MANNQEKKPGGSKISDVFEDAGKSKTEAEKMGEVDNLDRVTDKQFDERRQTNRSPAFKALFKGINIAQFRAKAPPVHPQAVTLIEKVVEIVCRHRDGKPKQTLFGEDSKLSPAVTAELAAAGFGGIRIPTKHGGTAADLRHVMRAVTEIGSKGDLTVAGTINVHGLIGPTDPLMVAGTEEQQAFWLPQLASWQEQGFFALTEKNAGSDLTNIWSKTSVKNGQLVVNGMKLFISNSYYGRVGALVCMHEDIIDGKPQWNKAVFIIKLPDSDTENFELVNYGLYPLRHMHNHGLKFKDFPLDLKNRVQKIDRKTGKPIPNSVGLAYEALNKGRTAIIAMSAAGCRVILNDLVQDPDGWTRRRETFGAPLKDREGVKGAIARVGMLICGLDAMRDYCATLLDEGWRGELECVVGKNFGAQSITEAAIKHGMRVHGGRSMLHGHFIGDYMFEFLVENVYEGAEDMLRESLHLSSFREHMDKFMMPLGESQKKLLKFRKPITALAGLAGLGFHGARLGSWWAGQKVRQSIAGNGIHPQLDGEFRKEFQSFIDLANRLYVDLVLAVNAKIIKYKRGYIDKQLLHQRFGEEQEDLFKLTCFAAMGAIEQDEVTRLGLHLMCRSLVFKLTGQKEDEAYDYARIKFADMILAGKFRQLDGVMFNPPLMQYW